MTHNEQEITPIDMQDLENEILQTVDTTNVEEIPTRHAAYKMAIPAYC